MRRLTIHACTCAVALGLLPAGAAAQMPPAPTPVPESATQRVWYGHQILIADAVSLGTLAIGVGNYAVAKDDIGRTTGTAVAVVGGVGTHLAAPIVHWAHGHVGIGFVSLALRTLLPIAGGYLAAGSDGFTNRSAAVAGNLVGLAAAIVVDTVAFAYDDVPVTPAAVSAELPFVPQLSVTPQGFSAGLAHAF
jgi:hypothetical protein